MPLRFLCFNGLHEKDLLSSKGSETKLTVSVPTDIHDNDEFGLKYFWEIAGL